MLTTPVESALVVIVAEIDDLVAPFRLEHDPSAAAGIPAHVTVLYPFKAPRYITAETIEALHKLFMNVPPFEVSFAEVGHLPGVLYLVPEPDEPFRRMTEAVSARFPETPPYAGQFSDIIPHLTIAQTDDANRLQQITTAFIQAAEGALPVHAGVRQVVLLDNETHIWRVRHRFMLGECQADRAAEVGRPSIK